MREISCIHFHKRENGNYNQYEANNSKIEYCTQTLSVGLIVKIFDGSANIDKNTLLKRPGIDELFETNAEVIEINIVKFVQGGYDWIYNCNILLEFPTGEQVYCNSDLVKIVK